MTTIGIVGGGQLARMLALAAHPLGVGVVVLDPDPTCPASVAAECIASPTDDVEGLRRLAERSDVVTFESENVDPDAVRRIADRTSIAPSVEALAVSSDRLSEKTFFRAHGVATPAFAAATSVDELRDALERVGLPALVKTRRMGYDGKGQFIARSVDDAGEIVARSGGAALIAEAFVRFDRELSVVLVRSRAGEVRTYPVTQNEHRDGILRVSIAPAPALSSATAERAIAMTTAIADALEYVGVLALELFDCGGELVANEMAPRVHNSGHWTIDGAAASQFENHVRATCGLPLGETTAFGSRAMVNLIGSVPPAAEVLAIPGTSYHVYGKEPRPERKVGHVNIGAPTAKELADRIAAVRAIAGDAEAAAPAPVGSTPR